MNNLVAYDADSDDESPRRRSSEAANLAQQARRRRTSDAFDDSPQSKSSDSDSNSNFAEPPPPKRITEHSPSPASFPTPLTAIPHVSSTASLVSYSGEGEDEESENHADKPEEPAPPAREADESDEEQQLIDLAIQEGNEALNRMNEEFSPNDISGQSSPNHAEKLEKEEESEIRIPAAPDIEVNPAIAARFEHAFRQKAGGTDLNRQIQGNQQYNNPMSYDTFIEAFDIDEKGTNFASNIFDPHCFPENCFYDAIGEEQRKLNEAPKKNK